MHWFAWRRFDITCTIFKKFNAGYSFLINNYFEASAGVGGEYTDRGTAAERDGQRM